MDGTDGYKGTPAITRVAMEDYIQWLMKKDTKATELCQLMRDHIETFEGALKDSKVKLVKMHRENLRKIKYATFGKIKFLKVTAMEQNCWKLH